MVLAVRLWLRRYDVVWTQWPAILANTRFWHAARLLRLPLVHTVHNVIPHEATDRDHARMATVYRRSRALLVHSHTARRALIDRYPELGPRVVVQPLGVYTTYPDQSPARPAIRERLGVTDEECVVLAFGWIRPYKNTESLVAALAAPGGETTVLVIAGRESGYPDLVPDDPVGRTRALARTLGVESRVRFLPGQFTTEETAELFAATDVVALPYTQSDGSGLLLLAMSFDVHIVATRVGGMDEYLARYPRHTFLEGTGPAEVAAGLAAARARLASAPPERRQRRRPPPIELQWPHVAVRMLASLTDGAPDWPERRA